MRNLLVVAALFAFPFSAFAGVPEDDGIRGRQALGIELRNLLDDENFSELDRRAANYAEKQEGFSDGWWKLTEFFVRVAEPADMKNERAWKKHFEHLEHWIAKAPANEVALTAQAAAFSRYAWVARGGGYADTLTEEGVKLFVERLSRAREILSEVKQHSPRERKPGAGWYTTMMTVALGQGWAPAEYNRLFNEAIATHPDYYEFYLKKAHFLLPRWMGAEGEWQQFAREAGKTKGPDVFARICWANGAFEGFTNLFTTCGITWHEMDRGFAELLRKFPNSSWTLNYYCRLACAARQRTKAATLFEEIGADFYVEAWTTRDFYEKSRAWALPPARR